MMSKSGHPLAKIVVPETDARLEINELDPGIVTRVAWEAKFSRSYTFLSLGATVCEEEVRIIPLQQITVADERFFPHNTVGSVLAVASNNIDEGRMLESEPVTVIDFGRALDCSSIDQPSHTFTVKPLTGGAPAIAQRHATLREINRIIGKGKVNQPEDAQILEQLRSEALAAEYPRTLLHKGEVRLSRMLSILALSRLALYGLLSASGSMNPDETSEYYHSRIVSKVADAELLNL